MQASSNRPTILGFGARLAGAAALTVLAGSRFGLGQVTALGRGFIPMAPVSALLALLLAVAMALLAGPRRGQHRAGRALALGVAGLSLWNLAGVAQGFTMPLERLLALAGLPISRVSFLTPLALAGAAGALLLGGGGPRLARRQLAALTALLPVAIGALVLFTYAVGAPLLYDSLTTPMSLPSALLALVFGLSLLPAFGADTWPYIPFRAPDGPHLAAAAPASSRRPLIGFLILVLGVWVGGSLFLRSQLGSARRARRDELAGVAQVKAEALANWYRERAGDALRMQESALAQRDLSRFLSGSPQAPRPEELRALWQGISRGNCANIVLFDAEGRERLALAPGLVLAPPDRTERDQALRSTSLRTTDWRADSSDGSAHLCLWVPVRGPGPLASGVVLFWLDAAQSLIPQIKPWPGAVPSLEVYLALERGGWLGILERPGRLAAGRVQAHPEAPALYGGQTGGNGGVRDGEGRPGIASRQPVAGTPWAIFAKVDEAEAYATLRQGAWITGGALLGLMVLAALAIGIRVSRDHAARMSALFLLEKEFQASERHHRTLVDLLPDAVVVVVDGRFRAINPAGVALFGAAGPGELIGQPYLDRVDPASREASGQLLQAVVAGRSISAIERNYLRLDGSPFCGEIAGTTLVSHGEAAAQLVIRDITARKQESLELLAREERLRILFERMPIAIVILGTDNRIISWNPAAEAVFGYSSEQALGREPRGFIVPADLEPRLKGVWQQLLEGQLGAHSVNENCTRDGRTILCEWTNTPFRDSQGNVVGVICMVRDITDLRRAEYERARLTEQLAQSQKLESLGSLAGGVAHDINNVLAAILSLASGHRTGLDPQAPLAKSLETIVTACLRGRDVVKSLLYFARKDLVSIGPVDLNGICRDLIALLRSTTLKRIELITELHEPLGLIEGDAAALSHALMNLFVNAMDAMPEGGRITLRTRLAATGGPEVSVNDTGQGMAPEVLERAMEPFYTTKPLGQGTGLGLSMVFGAMQAHKGSVAIRSAPGQGTTVTLTFPALLASVAATAAAEAAPEAAPAPARICSVLLVDDDELIRLSVAPMLQLRGYQVQAVESGLEGLAKVEGDLTFDLVILDMNMPGLNGAQTLDRLLALRPQQKVLLASGYSEDSVAALTEAHANVFSLRKPFSLDELTQAIDRI